MSEENTNEDIKKANQGDFKSRLIIESEELEVKTEKLSDFLLSYNSTKLDDNNILLLRVQENLMSAYLQVLKTRIKTIK